MEAEDGGPRLKSAATEERVRSKEVVNPPQQERSRDTLRRIVKAAEELLQERSFSEISVDDIVEQASSSKGSFYQRFSDKEGLLVHLLREEHDAAVARWSEFLNPAKWRGRPFVTIAEAFVDRLVEIYRGRPELMRVYADQVRSVQGEIRALSIQLNRHVLELLRRLARERKDEIGHPDVDKATGFLLTALVTLLPALFLSPTQELFPHPMDSDEMQRELQVVVRSYLGLLED